MHNKKVGGGFVGDNQGGPLHFLWNRSGGLHRKRCPYGSNGKIGFSIGDWLEIVAIVNYPVRG
jgi:hypothetical protein